MNPAQPDFNKSDMIFISINIIKQFMGLKKSMECEILIAKAGRVVVYTSKLLDN
jgi:hypothetical protein